MQSRRTIEYWPHDDTYRAFTITPLGKQEMTAPDGSPAFGQRSVMQDSMEAAKDEKTAMRRWLKLSPIS